MVTSLPGQRSIGERSRRPAHSRDLPSTLGGIMNYTTPSNYLSRPASLASILITIALSITAIAQEPGSLDPSFDGDGKKVESVIPGGGDDFGGALLVQPDGKIVTVGESRYGNRAACSATRHFANGTLDPSFGTGGKVLIGESTIWCVAAALQSDGKIIAAGNANDGANGGFALVRLNANGSLDTTFDGDGQVTTNIDGSSNTAASVAIQPDGKIVAAGNSSDGFALVRYNPNGSLDTTFDGDGILTTPFSGHYAIANAIAIQSNGKIVAGGSYEYNCDPDNGCLNSAFTVTRYNGNGSLDTTFDGDGVVTTAVGDWDSAQAVAIQSDGKIVAAGATYSAANAFALVRFNSDGTRDVTFDGDGIVTTQIEAAFDGANDLTIQPDGRMIVAGRSNNGSSHYDLTLIRYNTNGSLDGTFDGDGIVIAPIGSNYSTANAVALQSDGKIVAMATHENGPTGNDFALVRYSANGSLDASGFNGGIVFSDLGDRSLYGRAVAVQADGKIVAAGGSVGGSYDFALVRFNPDGSHDSTFDGDGIVTTRVSEVEDAVNSIVIQPDGKIIAVGPADGKFVVVRYNTDGTLDTTFDVDGIVKTQVATGPDHAEAVVLAPDGKIVVAGICGFLSGERGFAVARYNANGSLDTTFDGDGIATTNNLPGGAYSVAVQSDGKIVAAGFGYTGDEWQWAAVRYTTSGSLDTTFNDDGIVTTRINPPFVSGTSYANAVAIQSDGKIVTAGINIWSGTPFFTMVRYRSDGSVDQIVTNTTVGSESGAFALAIQPDRRIVLVGYRAANGQGDFALVRYNQTGLIDTTFGGGDGKTIVDFNNTWDGANAIALDGQGRAVVVGYADGAMGIARFFMSHKAQFDFDGDGKSDLSVFRPSDSVWYLNRSTDGFIANRFGLSTDKIVPADYDGDGKTDIAVFRNGIWWRIKSSDSTVETVNFGMPGDIPLPGDYNGDGRDEVAVYRHGEWWSEGKARIDFGLATDKPVPADYDGDGKTDVAIYRDGSWWRINSGTGMVQVEQFGLATDRPVVGDYDGDSRADLAVYRDGAWYLLQSNAGAKVVQFGIATDTPTPADYDGDGNVDLAVFRNGTWYVQQSTGGVIIRQFGVVGDRALPSAYLP